MEDLTMTQWEVICGNVGTVYRGANGFEARQAFYGMRKASLAPCGRASGESVVLMRDGEIVQEHIGETEKES
jgi:hypothetical protein